MRDPARHHYGCHDPDFTVYTPFLRFCSCLRRASSTARNDRTAKGLQRPFGDIQQLADLLVVQPRLRLADTVCMAERIHPSGKLLEPREHPLKGPGFYIDYSHGSVVLRSRERA